jgi:hypothetical protein
MLPSQTSIFRPGPAGSSWATMPLHNHTRELSVLVLPDPYRLAPRASSKSGFVCKISVRCCCCCCVGRRFGTAPIPMPDAPPGRGPGRGGAQFGLMPRCEMDVKLLASLTRERVPSCRDSYEVEGFGCPERRGWKLEG